MTQGRVAWFNNSKGYGFIRMDDGRAVFVHYTNILMDGYKSLSQGNEVSFELYESTSHTSHGEVELIARNVRILD